MSFWKRFLRRSDSSRLEFVKGEIQSEYNLYCQACTQYGCEPSQFQLRKHGCKIDGVYYPYSYEDVVLVATCFVDDTKERFEQERIREEQRQIYEPRYRHLEPRVKNIGGSMKFKKWGVKVKLPRMRKPTFHRWRFDYDEYDYAKLHDYVLRFENEHQARLQRIDAPNL